jgi:hypothetical protein
MQRIKADKRISKRNEEGEVVPEIKVSLRQPLWTTVRLL